jgi:hypothetical protein
LKLHIPLECATNRAEVDAAAAAAGEIPSLRLYFTADSVCRSDRFRTGAIHSLARRAAGVLTADRVQQ